MRSMRLLIKRLQRDYPQFTFTASDTFWWSAGSKTIHYDPDAPDAAAFCLHELSHGILDHSGYVKDIDLVRLERDAWTRARMVAENYGVVMTDDVVQHNLDTYRSWLHARSTCPGCRVTGIQIDSRYCCTACGQTWRSNEAKTCSLRRYTVQT